MIGSLLDTCVHFFELMKRAEPLLKIIFRKLLRSEGSESRDANFDGQRGCCGKAGHASRGRSVLCRKNGNERLERGDISILSFDCFRNGRRRLELDDLWAMLVKHPCYHNMHWVTDLGIVRLPVCLFQQYPNIFFGHVPVRQTLSTHLPRSQNLCSYIL